MVKGENKALFVSDQIEQAIVILRGQKVLMDEQLAAFYSVEVKQLIRQVKRNYDRFPEDFMFQLSAEEWESLRCQFGTTKNAVSGETLRSQIATAKKENRGGRRTPPYAFTEQGVAMLSSVIRSKKAIEVNIEIMRAFVRLRQLLMMNKELAERILKLEEEMLQQGSKFGGMEGQIQKIFGLLQKLFNPPADPPKTKIGFRST